MDETVNAGHVPVYRSRFTLREALPREYGAYINWSIGERVRVFSRRGKPDAMVTIKSDTLWHDRAPEIDGARGPGRWIREVIFDGEHELAAISEAQIVFTDDERPAASRTTGHET